MDQFVFFESDQGEIGKTPIGNEHIPQCLRRGASRLQACSRGFQIAASIGDDPEVIERHAFRPLELGLPGELPAPRHQGFGFFEFAIVFGPDSEDDGGMR